MSDNEVMLGTAFLVAPRGEGVMVYVRSEVKLPYLDRKAQVLWLECSAVPEQKSDEDGIAYAAGLCLELRSEEFGGAWTVDVGSRAISTLIVYIIREWPESESDLTMDESDLERFKTVLVCVPVKPECA